MPFTLKERIFMASIKEAKVHNQFRSVNSLWAIKQYFCRMKVLGIIPSRYGSSRFPGKPLLDLDGKSMIRRVYENASNSRRLHELVVATDDQRIFEHVYSFGGKAMMTSTEHGSGTDRCAEVARKVHADIIVNIQGDEPLVDPTQLDMLVEAFSDSSVQIATLAIRSLSADDISNPNRIKIVVDHNNNALYFSRSPIPNTYHFKGDHMDFYPFLKHIGLYAFRVQTLRSLSEHPTTKLDQIESLEQLKWLYYGHTIRVIETDRETPNIDVPQDVDAVLKRIAQQKQQ